MVIDDSGVQLGLMSPEDGRRIAAEKGLDLVEVAPTARPPVCRIMDYGRFRYEQRKRTKKQHQTQTKIIKLRPKTDPHDLETKLRHARRFLDGGDRVRFVVRMRGRERAVTDRWISALNGLTEQLADVGVTAGRPQLEGGGVTITVEPKRVPTTEERAAASALREKEVRAKLAARGTGGGDKKPGPDDDLEDEDLDALYADEGDEDDDDDDDDVEVEVEVEVDEAAEESESVKR